MSSIFPSPLPLSGLPRQCQLHPRAPAIDATSAPPISLKAAHCPLLRSSRLVQHDRTRLAKSLPSASTKHLLTTLRCVLKTRSCQIMTSLTLTLTPTATAQATTALMYHLCLHAVAIQAAQAASAVLALNAPANVTVLPGLAIESNSIVEARDAATRTTAASARAKARRRPSTATRRPAAKAWSYADADDGFIGKEEALGFFCCHVSMNAVIADCCLRSFRVLTAADRCRVLLPFFHFLHSVGYSCSWQLVCFDMGV